MPRTYTPASDEPKTPGELAIWHACLRRAIMDARGTGTRSLEARRWLSGRGVDDLLIVCGIELSYWRARVLPHLQRQWSAADRSQLARKHGEASPARREKVRASMRAYHAGRKAERAAMP